jgi:predicted sulfurtransferase
MKLICSSCGEHIDTCDSCDTPFKVGQKVSCDDRVGHFCDDCGPVPAEVKKEEERRGIETNTSEEKP